MEIRKLLRIDGWVPKGISHLVTEAMKDLRITEVFVNAGRSVVLRERLLKLGHRGDYRMEEDLLDFFSFYAPAEYGSEILSYLTAKADLSFPGRGSLFSTEVGLYRSSLPPFDESVLSALPKTGASLLRDLAGIVAIVRRGEGNDLAKTLLDTGRALPVVTYGEGVGLRDKLGLLRITVSAEKEIVHAVFPRNDEDENIDYLSATAKLDHPGKGFIYSYPIKEGSIDTRMIRGRSSYIASMEQIVSAIDAMKGHAQWRRGTPSTGRTAGDSASPGQSARETLRILCPEGMGNEKIRAALDLGAGGATQSRIRVFNPCGDGERAASHELETTALIVDKEVRDRIIREIPRGEDIVEISPVNRINTYRGGG